jgi:hypothetical protein
MVIARLTKRKSQFKSANKLNNNAPWNGDMSLGEKPGDFPEQQFLVLVFSRSQ